MKSKKFWSYEVCSQFNLTDEVLNTSKKRNKFYEDALYFYEIMGTGPHPSIKHLQGVQSPTSINFTNVLLDINTIKILFHLLPETKITSIKLSNNNFNLKCLEYLVKNLTEKENNINNISYEWNSDVIIDDIKYSYKELQKMVYLLNEKLKRALNGEKMDDNANEEGDDNDNVLCSNCNNLFHGSINNYNVI